jgi:hypothetical protein
MKWHYFIIDLECSAGNTEKQNQYQDSVSVGLLDNLFTYFIFGILFFLFYYYGYSPSNNLLNYFIIFVIILFYYYCWCIPSHNLFSNFIIFVILLFCFIIMGVCLLVNMSIRFPIIIAFP